MMSYGFRMLGFAILLGSTSMLPVAKADDWNKATDVTLNAPMAIPGRVLQPGKYVFELDDSPVDRNIVEILNADKTQVVAKVLTVPAVRVEPTSDTVIQMNRETKGPEAIRTWFFAGDYSGVTFVYPSE